jgi:hypothetical protein
MIGCGSSSSEEAVSPAVTKPTPVNPAEFSRLAAEYVGREACVQCHAVQHEDWQGSHHDLAMQAIAEAEVLGDFDNQSFTDHGTTTTFFRRGEEYWVRSDGPDGTLQEYQVLYTFGVEPLQQYLVQFPQGHLQALNVVWDARAAAEGGQRWVHLYDSSKELISHQHPFHWTGLFQNWNTSCAECHSTDVRRNYAEDTQSYRTSWHEVDVSCESCHGPGSSHVAWAQDQSRRDEPRRGLTNDLSGRTGWQRNPATGSVHPKAFDPNLPELHTCAPCHSRRGQLLEGQPAGTSLHDHMQLSLLDEHLYFADGSIQDEVFVFGSFLQSKMYHAGVRCTDCHNAHTLETRLPGAMVCAQCHDPEVFAVPSHHHHAIDSAGASCLDCHMPARTYMAVDDRRDHAFSIPRPGQLLGS